MSLSIQRYICNFRRTKLFRHFDTHFYYMVVFLRDHNYMYLRSFQPSSYVLYEFEYRHFHIGGYNHSSGPNYLQYSWWDYNVDVDVDDGAIRAPHPGA